MISWIAPLLLSLTTSVDSAYLVGEVGLTLHKAPRFRAAVGAIACPFPDSAFGGLGQVNVEAAVFASAGERHGDLGVLVLTNYGRPRSRLWFSFQGGASTMLGLSRGRFEVLPISPVAALRFSYGEWSMRLLGFVTNKREVVRGDYYSLMIERLWNW